MNRPSYALLCLPLLLGGCEPERGIRSNRDFASEIDVACVDRALRQTFGEVNRWDYVSDGATFPKGTPVAQFAYYKWDDGVGWAKLEIGPVDGKTRISQSFTGIGAELPQGSFPLAMKAMTEASAALKKECGVNLSGMEWREIGQDVAILD
jgi:hypothetical protein